MRGELLWVYEGLTEYLGVVLATRSGLWTIDDARTELALDVAALDASGPHLAPARGSATSAQSLYTAPSMAPPRDAASISTARDC